MAIQKIDLYTFLTASVGGVFGLCLGASIISLIEVIYFIVFRVFGRTLFNAIPNCPSVESKAEAKLTDEKIFKKGYIRRNRRIYHNGNPFGTQYNNLYYSIKKSIKRNHN